MTKQRPITVGKRGFLSWMFLDIRDPNVDIEKLRDHVYLEKTLHYLHQKHSPEELQDLLGHLVD